jgi:hypothetical protein
MLLITYKHATGIESMQKHIASCSQKSCSVDGLDEKKTTSYSNSVKN